jgi:hypothetical protein
MSLDMSNKLLVDQIAVSRNNNNNNNSAIAAATGIVNSTALTSPAQQQPASQQQRKKSDAHATAQNNKASTLHTDSNQSSNSNLSLAFQKYGKDQPQQQQQQHGQKQMTSVPSTPASDTASDKPTPNLGILNFAVEYIPTLLQLKITLISASNLPACDSNGFSDPYVKLHLLPGIAKATKLRSKTIYKNLNPTFNETFHYDGVTVQDMDSKTLR